MIPKDATNREYYLITLFTGVLCGAMLLAWFNGYSPHL